MIETPEVTPISTGIIIRQTLETNNPQRINTATNQPIQVSDNSNDDSDYDPATDRLDPNEEYNFDDENYDFDEKALHNLST